MPSLNDLDKAVNFLTRLFVKIKKCFLPQWQSDVNFYSLYTLRNFWTYQMTAVRTKVFRGVPLTAARFTEKTERIAETF